MQKKGKERFRLFSSTPIFILFLVLAAWMIYLYQREPAARDISYGELMQILSADDPAVRFRNVVVTRDEIRGDIISTDTVSNGTSEPAEVVENRPFRTKIGWAGDPELAKKLNARVGSNYKVDQDDSPLKFFYSLISLMIMLAVLIEIGRAHV